MPENCILLARRNRLKSLVKPVILFSGMALLCWCVFASAEAQYRWQWYRVWRYIGFWEDGAFYPGALLHALLVSMELTAASMVFALAFGVTLAGMRLSASPVARSVSSCVLGALRNTPLLMQMFMVYFVVAPVLGMPPFLAAVFSLGLFEGAYISEILRAGLLAIPRSQWEAALGLGMSVRLAACCVIAPQAVRRVLSPLAGQLVSLIKDTSLVSAIAVADLTMQARIIITDTFLSFEVWLITAGAYLALTLLVSIPAKLLEHEEEK